MLVGTKTQFRVRSEIRGQVGDIMHINATPPDFTSMTLFLKVIVYAVKLHKELTTRRLLHIVLNRLLGTDHLDNQVQD